MYSLKIIETIVFRVQNTVEVKTMIQNLQAGLD